jgi:multiple sugar transport system substrate-binding protein
MKEIKGIKIVCVLLAVVVCCVPAMATTTTGGKERGTRQVIKMLYFDWAPCHQLGNDLVTMNEEYDVVVDCADISEWYSRTFEDFAKETPEYDIMVMDTQWLGEAVDGKHIVELTDFINENLDLGDFYEDQFLLFSESPPQSGRLYGVPLLAGTPQLVFRRDIWRELGVLDPTSLTELLEVSQRITNDNERFPGTYGFASFWCPTEACYDQAAISVNQVYWSHGGEIWEPRTYRIDGVLQSDENIAALEFVRELVLSGPPRADLFDYGALLSGMCDGTLAMTWLWDGFDVALQYDPVTCPFGGPENLGWTTVPGEVKHAVSIGGAGLHVNAHVSPERQQRAIDFIAWSQRKDVARSWSTFGAFTLRKSIIATSTFLGGAENRPIFAVSLPLSRDFWNLREFNELLSVQNRYLALAMSGEMSAREALELTAKDQQAIIDAAYPDGPPRELVSISDGALIGLLIVAGVLMLVCVLLMALVAAKHAEPVFHFSSPLFLEMILLGLVMLLSSLFAQVPSPPTDTSCGFRMWLAIFSVCLIIGPLLSKTWRMMLIWRSSQKFRSIRVTVMDALRFTVIVTVPIIVLLIVWTAVDPSCPNTELDTPDDGDKVVKCDNDNLGAYLGVLFGYFGLLLASGCVLAFLSRHVATEFNESAHITIIFFNSVLIACIVIPLIFFISDDPTVVFVLEAIGIIFFALLFICVLFGPKIYALARGKTISSFGSGANTSSRMSTRLSGSVSSPTTTDAHRTPSAEDSHFIG